MTPFSHLSKGQKVQAYCSQWRVNETDHISLALSLSLSFSLSLSLSLSASSLCLALKLKRKREREKERAAANAKSPAHMSFFSLFHFFTIHSGSFKDSDRRFRVLSDVCI